MQCDVTMKHFYFQKTEKNACFQTEKIDQSVFGHLSTELADFQSVDLPHLFNEKNCKNRQPHSKTSSTNQIVYRI